MRSTSVAMTKPALKPRILLVEDDFRRIEQFRAWIAGTEFVLIEASSGGRAKGMLRPGMTDGIAGILLDHDLEKQPLRDTDLRLSASHLVDSIVMTVPRHVPVLIHSMNAAKPPVLKKRLASAGFSVTRIRMASLTPELFDMWLQEVRDNWNLG